MATHRPLTPAPGTGADGPLLLLTGASGYVGGRLLLALESRGYRIRCLARRPETLRGKVSHSTEIVGGDVLDPGSLERAMAGVSVAFFLVHSMGSRGSFEESDRTAARNFANAARAAGVGRIIYLGGLGSDAAEELSPHLRSRQEVGRLLAETGVPVLEFRASIVIGSGSLSYELIRSLVEALPVMVTPKWVDVKAQPIAIDDLIEYLVRAVHFPLPASRIIEIGGADRVSYAGIMREYARQRGLRIWMLRVPVLTPWLSSLWLGLITPVYARVGRKLIESMVHPTIVHDPVALTEFPFVPVGVAEAVRRVLSSEETYSESTRWTDALSSGGEVPTWNGVQFGRRLMDRRTITIAATPAEAFAPIQRIGGAMGYYAWNWLWQIRGWLDLLVGGVGMRRGRPSPTSVRVGDALDFWRVERFVPDRTLRLEAEMRLPGRAWLEWEVTGDAQGTTITQTAMFDPVGRFGRLYWYSVAPLHQLVFGGMLRGIARAAQRGSR